MSKADEYRAKALAAELLAQRTLDPVMRTSYEDLARGWLELARNAEWLAKASPGADESAAGRN